MRPEYVAEPSIPLSNGVIPSGPAAALAEARVDLIQLIRDGIPERRYVPGSIDLFVAGKRYLWAAPAGTGKSLVAQVVGVDVVDHGGSAAILDVENGSDEYAARLDDVLRAREGTDGPLHDACQERLHYFAWPLLSKDWPPAHWSAAFAGIDLVIFDSSRFVLTSIGLAEDANDDYATFANALLLPLSKAGITTLVLDNTGHENVKRPRGAKAKEDLNEVVYAAKVGKKFDRQLHGQVVLQQTRTRFPDLPGEVRIPLGGGSYGPPQLGADQFRPTVLMERISEALEIEPGMSKTEIRTVVRGKNDYIDGALHVLIEDGYVRIEQDGQAHKHHSVTLYRAADDPRAADDA